MTFQGWREAPRHCLTLSSSTDLDGEVKKKKKGQTGRRPIVPPAEHRTQFDFASWDLVIKNLSKQIFRIRGEFRYFSKKKPKKKHTPDVYIFFLIPT